MGNEEAQYKIGTIYLNGQEVPRDEKKAYEWMCKAAGQGHAKAQYNLAVMHLKGKCVAQDRFEAFKWMLGAAQLGHVGAQRGVALMYYEGSGVEENHAKAFEWMLKAAEQGNPQAQQHIAEMYENGDGVNCDILKAAEWTERAESEAQKRNTLVGLYNQGDAEGTYQLGLLFLKGYGVEKSPLKALSCFTKAAEQGHGQAMYEMGTLYHGGEGDIPKDEDLGTQWIIKAGEAGCSQAQMYLILLARDPETQAYWEKKFEENPNKWAY